MKSTNMACLTPEGALDGDCDFLSANLCAKSLFGEDALANLSIEKTEDGAIQGHVRIRSKTQGIALSLGKCLASITPIEPCTHSIFRTVQVTRSLWHKKRPLHPLQLRCRLIAGGLSCIMLFTALSVRLYDNDDFGQPFCRYHPAQCASKLPSLSRTENPSLCRT